jgi:hypothetical protein
MKLTRESHSADKSLTGRLAGFVEAIARFRPGKSSDRLTPRERYLAAIDASPVTLEQRRTAMDNAARSPGIDAALDEADRAYESLKEQESGELRGRSEPSSHRRA